MVVDIIVFVFDRSVVKGKVVIVSGDVDMILVVKESLKMKWFIEIWMWESSILNLFKKMVEENF